jgi:porin
MQVLLKVATLLLALAGWTTGYAEPRAADDRVVEFGALYVGDVLSNVHGGLQTGTAYVDYLELAVAVDAGPALGSALTGYASLIHTNAATFSDRYVGDAMFVSNIDTGHVLDLLEAWVQWGQAGSDAGSLRLGLYDINTEFDTTESRRLFMNSAYGIGHDIAQTGEYGPSIFPATAVAARFALSRESWSLKLAAVDANPGDKDSARGSRFHLSESEGALLLAEATIARGRVSQFSLGYWTYTSAFAGIPGEDGTSAVRQDNDGTYCTAEFAPGSRPHGDSWHWHAFIRAGEANGRINQFDRFVAAGLAVDTPWPAGRGAQLGLAMSEARVGDDYRDLLRRQGEPAGRHERNVELTWRVPLGEHLVVQPDVQYVIDPGATRDLQNALVLGIRFELAAGT